MAQSAQCATWLPFLLLWAHHCPPSCLVTSFLRQWMCGAGCSAWALPTWQPCGAQRRVCRPPKDLPSGVSTVMQNSLLWFALLFRSVLWSLAVGTKYVKVRRLEFAIVLVLFLFSLTVSVKSVALFWFPYARWADLWQLVEALLLPAFIPVFSSIVPLELVQNTHMVIGSCNRFVDHKKRFCGHRVSGRLQIPDFLTCC